MKFDYHHIKRLAESAGRSIKDLLALSPKNDPFYAGTAAQVDRGRWFAEQYQRAGYSVTRVPHLRRVHYWIVSQEQPVVMPNGRIYENTHTCWEYLMEASKSARYLGYISLTGIQDNKNPEPTTFATYLYNIPLEYEIDIPDLSVPAVKLYGLYDAHVQPYHLELWCEKSTMNDVLIPVCQRYGANLVTFEGEVSITSVMVSLMRRIIASKGKPTRIFYISDFDPAGNSMPVAMARKLEYALLAGEHQFDVRVRPLALTLEQVQQYRLPRTPIKETEKRAGKFEEAFGSGAVELDALEALYPGRLAQIVDAALKTYYSQTARREVSQAIADLQSRVEEAVAAVTAKYQEEIEALQEMQEELAEIDIDVDEYFVERHAPHAVEQDADWLYSSQRSYIDQLAFYKAHKGIDLEERSA